MVYTAEGKDRIITCTTCIYHVYRMGSIDCHRQHVDVYLTASSAILLSVLLTLLRASFYTSDRSIKLSVNFPFPEERPSSYSPVYQAENPR